MGFSPLGIAWDLVHQAVWPRATEHLQHITGSPSWFQTRGNIWSEFVFPCRFAQGEIHWSNPWRWSPWGGLFILIQVFSTCPCECPGNRSVSVPPTLWQWQDHLLEPSGLEAQKWPVGDCHAQGTLWGSPGASGTAFSVATQSLLGAFFQTSLGSSWCG